MLINLPSTLNYGSKILILNSVGWHIRQNNGLVASKQRQEFRLQQGIRIFHSSLFIFHLFQSTSRYFSRGMPRFLSVLSLLRSISLYTTSMALRVLGFSSFPPSR